MHACMHACMHVCIPFFLRFRNENVQKHRVFQIFGNRRQEAQASKKAGRGNRAWDPCFAATEKPCVFDVSRGGTKGGVILYPLLGIQ